MLEVRKVVAAYLKTLHPRVYFEQAPTSAAFPYLVFDFQLYPDGEGGELVTLSINGWDKPIDFDTTVLETLMANVNTLDKKTLITDSLTVTFFLENIIPIIDDDKSIKRRNYNYEGKLIRR